MPDAIFFDKPSTRRVGSCAMRLFLRPVNGHIAIVTSVCLQSDLVFCNASIYIGLPPTPTCIRNKSRPLASQLKWTSNYLAVCQFARILPGCSLFWQRLVRSSKMRWRLSCMSDQTGTPVLHLLALEPPAMLILWPAFDRTLSSRYCPHCCFQVQENCKGKASYKHHTFLI